MNNESWREALAQGVYQKMRAEPYTWNPTGIRDFIRNFPLPEHQERKAERRKGGFLTAAFSLNSRIAASDRRKESQPSGDWTEDFAHENGNYQSKCGACGKFFFGHKRRFTCKLCVTTQVESQSVAGTLVLVPRNPTAAMIGAAHSSFNAVPDPGKFDPVRHYKAMLAAVPPDELQRLAVRVRELERLHADAIELAKDFAERAELAEQQLAQCRKDAERYCRVRASPHMLLHLKNSEFDAAVDAAIGETKGEKP